MISKFCMVKERKNNILGGSLNRFLTLFKQMIVDDYCGSVRLVHGQQIVYQINLETAMLPNPISTLMFNQNHHLDGHLAKVHGENSPFKMTSNLSYSTLQSHFITKRVPTWIMIPSLVLKSGPVISTRMVKMSMNVNENMPVIILQIFKQFYPCDKHDIDIDRCKSRQ